jgi:hypothetical protein
MCKRYIVALCAVVFLVGSFMFSLSQQEKPKKPEEAKAHELNDKSIKSIEKGIKWLLKYQNKDGSWGCGEPATPPSAGITGLAVLAIMAQGDVPGRGKYGEQIEKAVNYLMQVADKTGKITGQYVTEMGEVYDHACALLALSQVAGMLTDKDKEERLKTILRAGVKWLAGCQNADGGWSRSAGLSDAAVTAQVWLALRGCYQTGLSFEKPDDKKIEKYAERAALNRFEAFGGGQSGAGTQFINDVGGYLRINYGFGRQDKKEVKKWADIVAKKFLVSEVPAPISEWDYVGAFHISQAFRHDDDKGGEHWKKWFPKARDYFVKIQNKDGSWSIINCVACKAFATALALNVLQVPYRLLPLLEL